MDSSTKKLYHVDGFDSRQHLEQYLSDKPEMVFEEDFLTFPIACLAKTFSLGHIKGDILIDFSIGSMVHHLFSACEFFKDIIVLKNRDRCIMELKRWVDTRTGAFDWGHAAKRHVDIEEKSDQLQDKEEKMKSALQHVVKCNLEKENITDPIVLPAADCIISAWLLDVVCKDQDDYIRYLRKISGLLKPQGHLILIGDLDLTYFTVGEEKWHGFRYDEEFARKALEGEGFVIDCCEVKERTVKSDLIDYKAVIFIAAHKQKLV
ncbi:nicotinamide N-methyltransferase-like [Bufo bufo]|uniref:nicotinamide N-methyltransferase-like n=1 Tax=Bufo bufo TaxID=8384 RepID=UPI001ABE6CD1|nr:nicotinamide N-methyltransferase-like [Bufo bufo]